MRKSLAKKRILVLGAGGPAGVNFISSLRAASEDLFIVGCDPNKYHLQWPELDEKVVSPRNTEPSYKDFVFSTYERFDINFVHTQPDSGVRAITRIRKEMGDDFSLPIFLPAVRTIENCQDKFKAAKIWEKNGLGTGAVLVESEDDLDKAIDKYGLPLWLRAIRGAGGRGSTPVENKETALSWMRYWRARGADWKFMAQEMLPGRNYAFHSVWHDGTLVCSQGRERLEYIYPNLAPSGITGTPAVAVTVHDERLNKASEKAVLSIDSSPNGVFSVDLKEDREQKVIPTEINAGRFFTTSYYFAHAGVNFPYIYLKLGYGEKHPAAARFNALPAGLYWIRHVDCPAKLMTEE